MPRSMIEAARDVAEVVEANADEGERIRRLPAATVAALTDAGLMRMCVPKAYGGPEVDPPTMLEAIVRVAAADGAAGWCSMIASTTSSMSVFLPAEAAKEIYGDPKVVTGGVFAPNGVGEIDGDRNSVTVSGRWPWGSGSQHCDWVLGGTLCDDDAFRLCWFPHDALTFHDTWHTGGMRGSGSLDYSVDGCEVPLERTIQPGVTPAVVDSALARFPNFSLLATCVAAVGLGVARHALDEAVEVARGKTPQFSPRTLAKSGYTQVEVSRAEGAWRAAHAFLIDEVSQTWDLVLAGDPVSLDRRAGLRLAAVHAATVSAEVTDTAYTLVGGTSVYDDHPLGRLLRDAHVVTQHIQTAPKMNETIGRFLLGLKIDTSMF